MPFLLQDYVSEGLRFTIALTSKERLVISKSRSTKTVMSWKAL